MKIRLRKININDEDVFKEQSEKFKDDNFNFGYMYDPSRPFQEYLDFLHEVEIGNSPIRGGAKGIMLLAENEQGEIVGRTSIRPELNDYLERIGGHIGYGVLREYRNKGYGTEILKETLNYIRDNFNIEKVLVTCDEDNVGSIKVIENNGGIYEKSYEGPEVSVPKRKYWIDLSR